MGLFKKRGDSYRPTSWQDLSGDELKSRIDPLIAFLATTMDGTQGLVVSPGSDESKSFMREVHDATKRLMGDPSTASQLDLSRQAYTEAAKEFGSWQREQVVEFQRTSAEALESIVESARSSMGDQDETLQDVRSMGQRLHEAESTQDITRLRDVVKAEARLAKDLFEVQSRTNRDLRKHFEESIRGLEGKLAQVEGSGSQDYLTECASRAALDFYLSAICRKAEVEQKLYSVAMMDMDDFKGINDLWGHQIGDRALGYFVKTLKQAFSKQAFIARYGGDEFVVVASMGAEELEDRINRIIRQLRRSKVPTRGADGGVLTLSSSAGVTEVLAGEEMESVLNRADEALYDAKKGGKGRVAVRRANKAA